MLNFNVFANLAMILLFALALVPPNAYPQERHALLIGNAGYTGGSLQALEKPIKDVEVLKEALLVAGWPTSNVKVVTEVNRVELYREIQSFAERAKDGVGFFYYSGHGGSAVINGSLENYLAPIEEGLEFAEDLPILGFRMEDLVSTLESAGAAGMFVVIDACRNALPSRGVRGGGMKGLRPIDTSNIFLAYATPDGQFAKDDGLYARILAEEIRQESQSADNVFLSASRRVGEIRGSSQNPVVRPAAIGEMCFISCADEFDPDEFDWRRFSKLEMYQEYLRFNPEGKYADEARARMTEAPDPEEVFAVLKDAEVEQDDSEAENDNAKSLPPASAAYCASGNQDFRVRFEEDLDRLPTKESLLIAGALEELDKYLDRCDARWVRLTGETVQTGDPQEWSERSRQMMDTVSYELIRLGLHPETMSSREGVYGDPKYRTADPNRVRIRFELVPKGS